MGSQQETAAATHRRTAVRINQGYLRCTRTETETQTHEPRDIGFLFVMVLREKGGPYGGSTRHTVAVELLETRWKVGPTPDVSLPCLLAKWLV